MLAPLLLLLASPLMGLMPLKAEMSHSYHGGCQGESVAPDAEVGNVSEESDVGLVTEPEKGNADDENDPDNRGEQGPQVGSYPDPLDEALPQLIEGGLATHLPQGIQTQGTITAKQSDRSIAFLFSKLQYRRGE